MATFSPDIMGSDDAFDYEYQMVTQCGLNYKSYLKDDRILTRSLFESNFSNICNIVNDYDSTSYQVLGVLALKTGSYLSRKYKVLITKSCTLGRDKTNWHNRLKLREIYLEDLKEKVHNHIAGQKTRLIRLQINNDDDLICASVGIAQFHLNLRFKNFFQIKHINLDSCKLFSIPKAIFNFHNLESLSLNSNLLRILPQNIFCLTFLKFLSVRDNLLELLPDNLAKNHSLTYLDLTRNYLTRLPTSISELHSLKYVYLSGNPSKRIPDGLPFKVNFPNLSRNVFFHYFN